MSIRHKKIRNLFVDFKKVQRKLVSVDNMRTIYVLEIELYKPGIGNEICGNYRHGINEQLKINNNTWLKAISDLVIDAITEPYVPQTTSNNA